MFPLIFFYIWALLSRMECHKNTHECFSLVELGALASFKKEFISVSGKWDFCPICPESRVTGLQLGRETSFTSKWENSCYLIKWLFSSKCSLWNIRSFSSHSANNIALAESVLTKEKIQHLFGCSFGLFRI